MTLFRLRSDEHAPTAERKRRQRSIRNAIPSLRASRLDFTTLSTPRRPVRIFVSNAAIRRYFASSDLNLPRVPPLSRFQFGAVIRTAITQATHRNRKYNARKAGRLAAGTARSITSPIGSAMTSPDDHQCESRRRAATWSDSLRCPVSPRLERYSNTFASAATAYAALVRIGKDGRSAKVDAAQSMRALSDQLSNPPLQLRKYHSHCAEIHCLDDVPVETIPLVHERGIWGLCYEEALSWKRGACGDDRRACDGCGHAGQGRHLLRRWCTIGRAPMSASTSAARGSSGAHLSEPRLVPASSPATGRDLGFHAGAQGQWGDWVLGVEAASAAACVSARARQRSSVAGSGFAANFDAYNKITNLFTVGPRLGYAWDRWMIFATGGYATGTVHGQYRFGAFRSSAAPASTSPATAGTTAGLPAAASNSWCTKVRWSTSFSAPSTSTSTCARRPPSRDTIFVGAPFSFDHDALVDIVRARLTIKTQGWGWTGPWK